MPLHHNNAVVLFLLMNSQTGYGLTIILAGAMLILLNKPIINLKVGLNKLFEMPSPSSKYMRIGTVILGIFFCLLGILLLLNIAHLNFHS